MLLYPSTAGRPRARRMLTEMTLTQQRRYQPFGLDRYAPAGCGKLGNTPCRPLHAR